MTRAAIYTRVSSEEQARPDKGSLGHQRQRCEAYCAVHEWEVAAVYEDAGVSGTKDHRPALDKMLADAKAGEFQGVVFLKVDRLARNLRHLVNLEHELSQLDVSIASVEDGFDTSTPSGRLHFNVLGTIAEFEREQIILRTTAGREAAAKQGQYNSGRPPFGWDYDKKTKKLAINEAESAVVRRIYDLYLRGLSYAALARRLNDQSVPTKTTYVNARSRDGIKKGWLPITVERILRNPAYYGEYRWNKSTKNRNGRTQRPEEEWISMPCPPIISKQRWQKARQQAKRNKKRSELCPKSKDVVSPNLLSGLTRCHCGRKMHSSANYSNGKVWRYLLCQGQGLYRTPCHEKRVNAVKVEEAVLDAIVAAFRDPRHVMEACDTYGEQLAAGQAAQEGLITKLEAKLEQKEGERQHAITLCTSGTISDDDLRTQLARIDKDVAACQDELRRLQEAARQHKAAEEVEQTAWAIAGNIDGLIGGMPIPQKKELIRSLVEQVTVHREGRIEIECAVPGLLDTSKVPSNNSPCATTSGLRAAR